MFRRDNLAGALIFFLLVAFLALPYAFASGVSGGTPYATSQNAGAVKPGAHCSMVDGVGTMDCVTTSGTANGAAGTVQTSNGSSGFVGVPPNLEHALPQNQSSAYYAFGGPYESNQVDFVPRNYTVLIGNNMGVGVTPFAYGSFANPFDCTIADQEIFANYSPNAQGNPVVTWLPSTYDAAFAGAAHEADTASCHMAGLTWLAIPKKYKTFAQAASVTTTGSWGNSSIYGGEVALTSTTQNSALTFTITTSATSAYVGYELIGIGSSTVSGGAFTVTVDGALAATVSAGGSGAFDFPISSSSKAPAAVRVALGATTTAHTIVTNVISATTTANPVTIQGVWVPPTKPYGVGAPNVYFGGQIYQFNNANSASTAAYNADEAALAAQLLSDGLAVNFVNVRNYFNSTTDLAPAGATGNPYAVSGEGQLHLADAFEGIMQYQRLPGNTLSPLDYGASCNAQLITDTYVSGGFKHLVTFTQGEQSISVNNWTFNQGTANQHGGGDVGKIISIFGSCDPGPTTYIASVTTAGVASVGWPGGAACSGTGYAVYGGPGPSNPSDPSTAQDDTAAIHTEELAAIHGGGKAFIPSNCMVGQTNLTSKSPLQIVSGVVVQGNSPVVQYNTGLQNNPNTSVTSLYIDGTGFIDDILYGMSTQGVLNGGLKDLTVTCIPFAFGFDGLAMTAYGR